MSNATQKVKDIALLLHDAAVTFRDVYSDEELQSMLNSLNDDLNVMPEAEVHRQALATRRMWNVDQVPPIQ